MNLRTNEVTKEEFKMDVVIATLNFDSLRKSLLSLRRNTPESAINSIILIDQQKQYQDVDDLVNYHVRCESIGFSAAYNLGIRISRTDYVMALNDDVFFLNKKWLGDCVDVFNKYGRQVLAVNPASIRNPISSGGEPVDKEGFPPKDDWTDDEYNNAKQLQDIGQSVYDTICTWGTIFNRYKLEKVESVIPYKCYFDESFWSGQDYKLNRDAYMTKNEDNDFRGYRLLGGGGIVRHMWYSTKDENGEAKVKYDPMFNKVYGIWDNDNLIEAPDLFGNKGKKNIIKNTMKNI